MVEGKNGTIPIILLAHALLLIFLVFTLELLFLSNNY